MTPAILDPAVLFGFATALHLAHASGMLVRLHRAGRQTAEELAGALGLDARATALVLRVLAAAGVVASRDSGFVLTEPVNGYLASLPGGAEVDARLWAHLPRFLTAGTPLELPARETIYSKVAGELGERWRLAAERLSAALPAALGRRVLDVGCGSGIWSLALLAQRPELQVTGLDFPLVLDTFARAAEAAGLRERVRFLPGDAFLCELQPDSFDLVVIANLLRLEPAPRARALVMQLARALPPTGSMLIIDAFAAGDDAAELARTVYALHLALRERGGDVHSEANVRAWLSDAGFPEVQGIPLSGDFSAVGALFARRRP